MAISEGHKTNFNTLVDATNAENIALMECTKKDTGKKVAVVCAVHQDNEGQFVFTPLAEMFNCNPYEILEPPM
jgi:hypothetical protein